MAVCASCGHDHRFPDMPGTYCAHMADGVPPCRCIQNPQSIAFIDDDPLVGRTPARRKMPYGWWSPPFRSRGWWGWALLCLLVGLLAGVDLPWWGLLLGSVAIVAVPLELVRTDAIQGYGAITFDYIEKVDPEIAKHLFWPEEAHRFGGEPLPPGENLRVTEDRPYDQEQDG